MDSYCALTGTYPAYVAGVLVSHYRARPVIRGLHIARTPSTIVDNIYRKAHIDVIGPFQFRRTEWLEYEGFPDFSIYDITFQGVTVSFSMTIVDVSTSCGSSSSINLTEFIWEYVC